MHNKILEQELRKNITKHEIFTKQTIEDLNSIKTALTKQINTTDLVIEFNPKIFKNFHLLYHFPYKSLENNEIWEYFVTLSILKELQRKFNIEDKYKLEDLENILLEKNPNYYLEQKDYLLTRKELINFLESLNLPNLRLHFIITTNMTDLCNELTNYLSDDLTFKTMIYLESVFYTIRVKPPDYSTEQWIWSVYDYIIFNQFKEGRNSSQFRIEKIMPDLKNEKIKQIIR